MGCRWFFPLPLAVLIVLLSSTGGTFDSVTGEQGLLPVPYGHILYSYNGNSPKQLYIVGISHKDTLTGAKSPYTPRVEAEVYRIGAWLAREEGVELILPEGFFAGEPKILPVGKIPKAAAETWTAEPDMKLIEEVLSDHDRSLNAEMLLNENFDMELRQIEERDLYHTVHEGIRKLADSTDLQQHFLIRSELDYHQDRRVGAMLQKVPEAVGTAYRQGVIGEEKALFTIGLSHIPSIVRFLREKKVAISCPLFTSSSAKFEECSEQLNLAAEGFGVTVILPRTLADDHRLLKRNRIKTS